MDNDRKKVIASSAAVTLLLAAILFSVASVLIANIENIVIREAVSCKLKIPRISK